MSSKQIAQAFILAAGLGTRMRPLTEHCPKPLIEVSGKPILWYIIKNLADYGVSKIILNSHYLAAQIAEYIEQIAINFPQVEFQVIYEPELLNSGGGVKNAVKFLDNEPFFAVNGDIIWLNNQANTLELLNKAWQQDLDCLMLAQPKELAIGYDGKGDLIIGEDSRPLNQQPWEFIFTGIQIYNPKIFNNFLEKIFSAQEIYFNPCFKVKAVINKSLWLHLGTPQNLQQVNNFLAISKNLAFL